MFNHKNPPKIKIRVIIIAILIIIILAAVVLNFTIKKDNTAKQTTPPENANPSSQTNQEINQNPPQTQTLAPQTQTSPSKNPPVQPTPTPQSEQVLPSVTASQLQSILQKSPEMNKLPDSTKLIIQFHNDINQFTGYRFFVGSKGSVSEYANQPYDMLLTININTIPGLEASTTVCSDIKRIIQSGKAWVIDQSSNPFVIMKYLPIKSCVI